ncbi:hypothetical protein T439DRAFT_379446 [Meredithblackwellia eburnea MCA 4105]
MAQTKRARAAHLVVQEDIDGDGQLFYQQARPNQNSKRKKSRKSAPPALGIPLGDNPSSEESGAPELQHHRDHEEQEKRRARFKTKCPKATLERYARVMSQRFVCLGRTRTGLVTETFDVAGSTGNVYHIHIGHLPSCSCPDSGKGHHCKHVMFIFLKVLRVPKDSNLWYQSALLTSELTSIFANAPRDRTTPEEQKYRQAYVVATGKAEAPEPGSSADLGAVQKRLPKEDDSCPICYEDFEVGQEKGLVFCVSDGGCGNGVHSQCHAEWARSKPANAVTCVFCRQPWKAPTSLSSAAGAATYSEDGYLNVASVVGMSTKRDTSSYYRGPQRGRRWGGGSGLYGTYDHGYDFEEEDYF